MADPLPAGAWPYRTLFLGLAALSLFARLLPLGNSTALWPGPDLLLCLTLAWILRRPDFVPALLIVAVFLVEDMLILRPPGLWTAIVLIGAEFLRGREPLTRELPFPLEWAMVAAVILLMMGANRLVLAITVSPQPGFAAAFLQSVLTILTYPVIVGFSRALFGLRKSATGEVDARGRRL